MSVSFVNLEIENFKYVVCGQVAVIMEVYTLPYDLSAIVCHFKKGFAILYLAVEYIF